MIKFEDKDYFISKMCSICHGKNDVKLINFVNNINKNSSLISLCKKCRQQLKELLKED